MASSRSRHQLFSRLPESPLYTFQVFLYFSGKDLRTRLHFLGCSPPYINMFEIKPKPRFSSSHPERAISHSRLECKSI